MMPVTDCRRDGLGRMPEGLLEPTPGARHTPALSKDGIGRCRTWAPGTGSGDRPAAIAAGPQSLVHGASRQFGDGSGGVRTATAESYGGGPLTPEAGRGAHLAVTTHEDAGPRLLGYHLNEPVEQIGDHHSTPSSGCV
jgi:hypothetical protein